MDRSKQGLIVGIPFTILVVGLIIYGNLSTSSHPVNFEWEYRPTLYICDDAPEWATPGQPDFEEAMGFWGELGWAPGDIQISSCDTICKTSSGVHIACHKGGVTLTLRGQDFGENHAGKCTRPPDKEMLQDNDWTTIQLPSTLDEYRAEVIAHEYGHCLVGVGHNLGPSVGCSRLNPKTGAVMNPKTTGLGWVTEGLPDPPAEWDE
jgi:hypothetical protein